MADIMTPALGESVTEATVARWAKKAGEAVRIMDIAKRAGAQSISIAALMDESAAAAN